LNIVSPFAAALGLKFQSPLTRLALHLSFMVFFNGFSYKLPPDASGLCFFVFSRIPMSSTFYLGTLRTNLWTVEGTPAYPSSSPFLLFFADNLEVNVFFGAFPPVRPSVFSFSAVVCEGQVVAPLTVTRCVKSRTTGPFFMDSEVFSEGQDWHDGNSLAAF